MMYNANSDVHYIRSVYCDKEAFMIEISLWEQLVAFADCGTLSEAAEKLHTSQPALTRSMKRLESELSLTLFKRSKNHMSLTDTGRMAVSLARQW